MQFLQFHGYGFEYHFFPLCIELKKMKKMRGSLGFLNNLLLVLYSAYEVYKCQRRDLFIDFVLRQSVKWF